MTPSQLLVVVASVLGGALWAVKSVAILATGAQPPVIFEAAVVCFALATAALARRLTSRRRRGALVVVGLFGLGSAFAALFTGEWGELFLLPATVASLVVMAGAGADLGRCRTIALAIALGTFPLFLVGGLLALAHERLLEIPLLVVSLLWLGFGCCQWREARQPEPAVNRPG